MNPFLLSPRSGSQSYLHFLIPGGGHKGKRNKKFCSLSLVPMVGTEMKGAMEPGEFRNICCACCAW